MSQPQRRCAFLSTDNLEDFFVYDRMLFKPMANRGWAVEEVSWRDQSVDWSVYEVVVVRSPWDYQDEPELFQKALEKIVSAGCILENSLSLIEWNISKHYLAELESKGVPIVPTRWFNTFVADEVLKAVDEQGAEDFVIKPVISANADDTYRLNKSLLQQSAEKLAEVFSNRDFMLQPFLNAIQEEGEYSLFYFGGHYSHTILKVPKDADFRVQEEHGGSLHSVEPEDALLTLADKTLAALPEQPLYARLDYIRSENGFQVMEVESIEPSLYFNMDEDSPQRFTDAFCEKFGEGQRT